MPVLTVRLSSFRFLDEAKSVLRRAGIECRTASVTKLIVPAAELAEAESALKEASIEYMVTK